MSDGRAVSTTLSYVLALAIATVLVTGLLLAGGNYVDSQREQVVRDELGVVGQQLAADVERADRLVRAGDGETRLTVNRTLPNRVTGASYRLTLVPSEGVLVVNTTRPAVTVRVGLTSGTDLAGSQARGGVVQIRYDRADDHLEVRDV